MAFTTKHQVLAWDLVEGLDDEKHKGIYFRLAKTYDEGFLRRILSLVKDACRRGNIKSEDRGRYFMGILNKELKINGGSALISRSKPILNNNGKSVKNHARGQRDAKKKGGAGRKSKKS